MCQSGCDIFIDWISNADPIYHSPGCKESTYQQKSYFKMPGKNFDEQARLIKVLL